MCAPVLARPLSTFGCKSLQAVCDQRVAVLQVALVFWVLRTMLFDEFAQPLNVALVHGAQHGPVEVVLAIDALSLRIDRMRRSKFCLRSSGGSDVGNVGADRGAGATGSVLGSSQTHWLQSRLPGKIRALSHLS